MADGTEIRPENRGRNMGERNWYRRMAGAEWDECELDDAGRTPIKMPEDDPDVGKIFLGFVEDDARRVRQARRRPPAH